MAIVPIDGAKNHVGIQVDETEDWGEGLVQAGSAIAPGMVVTGGTLSLDLVPDNDSGESLGWAAENQTVVAGGNVTGLRDAFAPGDRVRYGRQPGKKFMGLVASGQDLPKGAKLKTAAGKLVGGTEGTDKLVAVLIQEAGTGGALGADTHLLCKWGVTA